MSDLNELFKAAAEARRQLKEEQEKSQSGQALKALQERLKKNNDFAEQMTSFVENKPVVKEIIKEVEVVKEVVKEQSFQQPAPQPVDQNIAALTRKLQFLEQAIGRIAATGPGSGEVNFRYLDDVDRGTMLVETDNWVLEYDAATKKVKFTENIGPIRTVKFNTDGPQDPLVTGQMAWNPIEDCLDVRHLDGSTLQLGYENYIQVHNDTGSPLLNGTVVQFTGVVDGSTNPKPAVTPFMADSSAVPLYIVGVLTNDIPVDGYGRATVFGKVRGLNTTGSDVGETWVQGDLLWAHPTMAGKMTKVQPTAPNVVISVAAVLHVDATGGWILVRPTIFPRLYFASFASDQEQAQTVINTPKAVTFNTNIITSGFTTVSGGGSIKALNAGLYNFRFSLQLHSSNASTSNVWIWARHNGVDIPLSARKTSISGNNTVLVPSWEFQVSMVIDDTFQLMWASDSTNVHLFAPAQTAFCPSTPSATLAVSQVNL